MKNKILSMLIISATLLVVLIYLGDIGELIIKTTEQHTSIDLGIVNQCDPQKNSCSVSTQYQQRFLKLSLHMNGAVKALEKFQVFLMINGLKKSEIKRITIDYSMQGMDMGENRNSFQLVSANVEKSHWQSEGLLPVCVSGQSSWLAEVKIELENEWIIAGFPFDVH